MRHSSPIRCLLYLVAAMVMAASLAMGLQLNDPIVMLASLVGVAVGMLGAVLNA